MRRVLWAVVFAVVGAALFAFGFWIQLPVGTKLEAPGDFFWRPKLGAAGEVFGAFFIVMAVLPYLHAFMKRRRRL